MTIVASNSLTISNVNDGTITHYAYAYSADGTDRFTTNYPNLNLLKGTRTPNSVTGNNTSNQAGGIYFFDNNKNIQNQGLSVGDTLTCEFDWSVSNPTSGTFYLQLNNTNWKSISQRISITSGNKSGHSKFSFVVDAGFLAGVATGINRRADYLPTNSVLTISNVIFTKGSNANPWMPSSSEVTTADWPSYIGQYTDFNTTASTDPAKYAPWIIFKGNDGKDGIAGKDGVGLKNTVITYAISTSGTTAPTTGWTSSVPTLVKGQFLWTKTIWTYTDNSSETGYSVTYISKDGNNGKDGIAGKDGVGIKTTTITYVGSRSGTTAPTTGWSPSVPSVPAGQFLWTKTVWRYSDSTSETGYSVAKMGNTGATGPAGTPGSTGAPGKIVSNTEPISLFKGLTWKYSGTANLTASDGTVIHPNTEYYYNGTHWVINYLSANNFEANSITADLIDAKNLTITDGEFVSTIIEGSVKTQTEIKDDHLLIYKMDTSTNSINTIALKSDSGLGMTYQNSDRGEYTSAGVNFQGLFMQNNITKEFARLTPQGTKLSTDVPWTTLAATGGFSGGTIQFSIQNGVAYFSVSGVSVPSMTGGTWYQCAQLPTGSRAIPSVNRVTTAFANASVWGFLVSVSGGLYFQSKNNTSATGNLANALAAFPIG
ncbi:hypothetical protein P7H76_04085 [Lactococcus lactis]|uniref:hypothetical protein n=1 Tax=Lactococcus lactis TaxID=1358 RepID=UPI00288FC189|nr:hypothetical protein [Lactococcus lactis]MDT2886358.1 hypothetical protein [Lactococcus lactis]MDT2928877.1 hypothetical protein [Lactococcus lactis]